MQLPCRRVVRPRRGLLVAEVLARGGEARGECAQEELLEQRGQGGRLAVAATVEYVLDRTRPGRCAAGEEESSNRGRRGDGVASTACAMASTQLTRRNKDAGADIIRTNA